MLEQLLPERVVSVETRRELIDVELFPEEMRALGSAVEKRRREFITGRACARAALEQLGVAPAAIASGPSGEPLWPAGVVGSITHCRGYRACAVARQTHVPSLGIDVEPHEPLASGILAAVSSVRERRMLTRLRLDGCGDKLLFCAKEAVYKAWFPLTGRQLGFEDVDLSISSSDEAFRAQLLVPAPIVSGRRVTDFHGRWRFERDLVATAVAV
jgi:4'-phosphopantetheinyl transferase EntD